MERRWFDRKFELGLPVAAAPAILDRLRTAPVWLEESVRDLSPAMLTHRPDGHWSIQENVGHLLDLEPLWEQRLDDFERGAAMLHAADVDNRKTHEARHNDRRIADLLSAFRTARLKILSRLQKMDDAALMRTALHPRLQQRMSVVDLSFFVAEHDSHHLATIREISQALASTPDCALELVSTIDRSVPGLLLVADDKSRRRPAPGKWSPREIVGHLIDSASMNHQRFVRATFQDDLVFAGYAQDDWVAAQKYHDAPWIDLVTLWAGFNRHLARVMTAVPESTRAERRTRHNLHEIAFRPVPPEQPATLDYFMRDYVEHLQHHLRQIAAITHRDSGSLRIDD